TRLNQRNIQLVVSALLVDERYRLRNIHEAIGSASHALHAIQRVCVTQKNAMLAFGKPGWNLEHEVALQALAAIGAQENLYGNLRAGFDFARRNPSVFDGGHAALRQDIDGSVDALELGHRHWIEEEAVEFIAPPAGQ